MLSRFNPSYPGVSLSKLTLALIWLRDYISKVDSVVLVVIEEIAPSKTYLIVFVVAKVKIF